VAASPERLAVPIWDDGDRIEQSARTRTVEGFVRPWEGDVEVRLKHGWKDIHERDVVSKHVVVAGRIRSEQVSKTSLDVARVYVE
jgi:hypothetical protein